MRPLNEGPKIRKEKKVVSLMISKYCSGKHGTSKDKLCPNCFDLQQYAHQRLSYCIWGEKKPFCSKCPIHCYNPKMKERIIEVMKYSGPRMIFSHPIMAINHMLAKYKKFDDPRVNTTRKYIRL